MYVVCSIQASPGIGTSQLIMAAAGSGNPVTFRQCLGRKGLLHDTNVIMNENKMSLLTLCLFIMEKMKVGIGTSLLMGIGTSYSTQP